MKLTTSLSLPLCAFLATATPARLEDRQAHRACFHKGSIPLCCPETGKLVLVANNCSTPAVTSSALGFRNHCLEEKLTALCCEQASGTTGLVCAPVPADPPS